jgi:peptide/nickel transport system substrate-binding protein
MSTKSRFFITALLASLVFVLSACTPAAEPETITVIETVEVVKEIEGETVTVIETVVVEVEKPTEVPPVEPNILRVRVVDDPASLDPAFITGAGGTATATNVFEGLISYKPGTFEVVNVLAETIDVSADGLVIDFKLKEGIQFHGGYGELTAEDVKFSYERLIDPELDSAYAGDWAALDHVEVTGTYTGQIIMSQYYAPLWTTTLPVNAGWILSKAAYEANGVEGMALNPIGTGPYEFVEIRLAEAVVLERYADYWGEMPVWDEIHMIPIPEDVSAEIAIHTGEIDFGEVPPDGIDRALAAGLEAVAIPTLRYEFVTLNVQNAKLADIRVRQAIRLALDVPLIIEAAHSGIWARACAVVPPGAFGFWADAPCYDQDLDAARALMADAGVETLDLTIHAGSRERDRIGSEVVQAQLAEIGINVEVIAGIRASTLFRSETVNEDLALFFGSFGTQPDPSWSTVWWTCDQVGNWNSTELCSEEFDALHAAALAEPDQAKRQELYEDLQRVWDEAVSMIWIAYGTSTFAYGSDLVPAIRPDGREIPWAFTLSP